MEDDETNVHSLNLPKDADAAATDKLVRQAPSIAKMKKALFALRHAAPYVRKQLGFALDLRHTPALHFVRDTVEEKASRVDALLEGMDRKGSEW